MCIFQNNDEGFNFDMHSYTIAIHLISAKLLGEQQKHDPFWDDLNTHCGSELSDEL